MESGYKIYWTDYALVELEETYKYLEDNFTSKELRKLSSEIDNILKIISRNPKLFPFSETNGIRRIVIKKYNSLYYREKEGFIEILSFFSNRKNPDSSKLT
ncbi:MAG TPA: type II toxin-antitoxin system RelE/ParE family toxin [Chitinophagales bacterium]|nr:type II toxin-antitoxin system RelE/ParE family toxin [Chitinophagales bacterium]